MLESHPYDANGRSGNFFADLRSTEDLPTTLQFWMAHYARDLLRLGVYFRAVALMSQIPGGAQYRSVSYGSRAPNALDEDDDPWRWVHGADHNTVFNVLAECLRRLEAERVMKRISGGKEYKREELSDELKACLDRHAKIKNGLLTVIAECLDELIVRPGMAEIDERPYATWWQRWWSRMDE